MNRALGVSGPASRRHPRARVDLPVAVAVAATPVEADDLELGVSRCLELSVGGMRVRHDRTIRPGTSVQVRLETVEIAELDLEARVVWAGSAEEEPVIGLAFETRSPATAALAAMVKELRTRRSWGGAPSF